MPDDFARDFLGFLSAGPSPWHAAHAAASRLERSGFRALDPSRPLPAASSGRFLVRRNAALVAWILPEKAPSRLVLGLAHTDSPCLRLRPQPEIVALGCRKLSVEAYGGLLNHSWLDRELEVAGRLCVQGPEGLREVLVRPQALRPVVPSLAVHLDRTVNERGLVLDRERHLPVLAGLLGGPSLPSVLGDAAGIDPQDILSWDLCLGDAAPPSIAGSGDLVVSPRLDNLASCHALLNALEGASPRDDALVVVALLDSEEVGSTWPEGADSAFLPNLLERIALARGLDRASYLALVSNGSALSVDMAHAVHPNHPEVHSREHAPCLGGGPVLKWNAGLRYATSAPGAARLRQLAAQEDVSLQTFAMRADLACGSTVGPTVSARLGIEMVDCGAPMLAMHSARETMALSDQSESVRLYRAFLAQS